MLNDWPIQSRADSCALTGRAFAAGEPFFTLLYRDPRDESLSRRDVCAEAWRQLRADPDADPPFSFWRTKFTPPAPRAPETLPKENAEALLRRFLAEGQPKPEHVRVCYVLALMLERKRLLKPVAPTEPTKSGDQRLLVYEHAKTGEVFLIVDPELRLDQIEELQHEVADLLQAVAQTVTAS